MARKRGKSTKKEVIQVKDGDIVRMIKDCIVGQYEEGDIGEVVQSHFIRKDGSLHVVLVRGENVFIDESNFVALKTKHRGKI